MKRVLALGFFDGVHLGHQALLTQVRQIAGESGMTPAALTFNLPPAQVLGTGHAPLLNTVDERKFMLTKWYGMELVTILPTTKALLETDWVTYVQEHLLRGMQAGHIVAGYDHRFGHRGEGSAANLQALCAKLGVGCTIVPAVEVDGAPVSSTRIRTALQQHPQQALALLGHPHLLSGTVAHGRSVGRTMGYPTVNIAPRPGVVLPANGVYISQVEACGHRYFALTNIGRRPTFHDSDDISIESFLLNFDGNLYGETIQIMLHHYLRGERRFESSDELAAEIGRNIEQARDFFHQQF